VWGGYNNQILESNTKIKIIWEILKLKSGRKNINEEAQFLSIDGKSANNPQTIADAFNEYFLSLVEKKMYL
jgi:hypothetical protein